MVWIQHGKVWDDDGDMGGDHQIGKVASVRFVNPDLPGRRVTVHAYAHAPTPMREITTKEGPVTIFYGFEHDLATLGIESQTWFEIAKNAAGDADEWEPTWSEIQYESLDTRPYGGDTKAAEADALAWVKAFDANRDIHWDGEPF